MKLREDPKWIQRLFMLIGIPFLCASCGQAVKEVDSGVSSKSSTELIGHVNAMYVYMLTVEGVKYIIVENTNGVAITKQ